MELMGLFVDSHACEVHSMNLVERATVLAVVQQGCRNEGASLRVGMLISVLPSARSEQAAHHD